MTLYGYAREPSTPEPEAPPVHVPQPRSAGDIPAPEDPDDLWSPGTAPFGAAVGTASVPVTSAPFMDPLVDPLPDVPVDLEQAPPPEAEAPEAEPADEPATVEPEPAAAASSALTPEAVRAAVLAWNDPDAEVSEIQPWDRRPLLVVLAAAAVLVLVGIVAGAASANLFRPNPAAWQTAGVSQRPSPGPTSGAAGPPVATDTITLSGVGDVIMGTQYRGGGGKIPPQNGQGFFDPVKSALASDLVMGNLETPLTVDTGANKCAAGDTECFQFFLPPGYANYLHDGGFQVMNLANNHTNDMGPAGLANTRAALEAAGVGHTGAPNEITIVEVKGVKVAVLGFSIYSWGGNLNNIPAAVNLVKKAATQADIVVVQMQGGAEGADKSHVTPGHEFFVGEDRGDLIAFSHAVIDAGADVVFGHGPHIMRGMEFYQGRLIAYSLGNFCGYGVLNSSGYLGVGGVLRVTLRHDGTWAGGTLVATQMVRGGMVDLDPNKRALGFVGGLSTSDFGANGARISTVDGSITPPAAS